MEEEEEEEENVAVVVFEDQLGEEPQFNGRRAIFKRIIIAFLEWEVVGSKPLKPS